MFGFFCFCFLLVFCFLIVNFWLFRIVLDQANTIKNIWVKVSAVACHWDTDRRKMLKKETLTPVWGHFPKNVKRHPTPPVISRPHSLTPQLGQHPSWYSCALYFLLLELQWYCASKQPLCKEDRWSYQTVGEKSRTGERSTNMYVKM